MNTFQDHFLESIQLFPILMTFFMTVYKIDPFCRFLSFSFINRMNAVMQLLHQEFWNCK